MMETLCAFFSFSLSTQVYEWEPRKQYGKPETGGSDSLNSHSENSNYVMNVITPLRIQKLCRASIILRVVSIRKRSMSKNVQLNLNCLPCT